MKHYQISEWLDFVHGMTSGPQCEAMEVHLNTQCVRCKSVVDLLQKIMAAATADMEYQVPEGAVRLARAIYSLQNPQWEHHLPRVVATLVFDSFREPAIAGMRSQRQSTRQALYEAGDYFVDLRLEAEQGSSAVVLVGQIASRVRPHQKMADIPVILMGDQEILGRTLSNAYGEFQFEYTPKQPLRLYLPLQVARNEIEIQLQNLIGPAEYTH